MSVVPTGVLSDISIAGEVVVAIAVVVNINEVVGVGDGMTTHLSIPLPCRATERREELTD